MSGGGHVVATANVGFAQVMRLEALLARVTRPVAGSRAPTIASCGGRTAQGRPGVREMGAAQQRHVRSSPRHRWKIVANQIDPI